MSDLDPPQPHGSPAPAAEPWASTAGSTSLDAERLWQVIAVSRTVLSELDETAVLDRVLQTAQQLTGARYAALGVLDEQRLELERFLVRGIDDETQNTIGELPSGRGVLGALIQDPRPLRLTDIGAHPHSYGFPAGHPVMSSFLGVPILIRGETWGNLYLADKAGEQFNQADEDAAVLLASWAAIAVEHARLHGAAQARRAELERAVRSLRATQEIAVALGGETDLDRILELVVKRGRALVEARGLVILLVDGPRLTPAASAGEVADFSSEPFAIEGSLFSDVLHRGGPERVGDIQARLHISPGRLGMPGASSAMLVPMLYRRSPVGVMIAFNHSDEEQFSGESEQALQAFAASAAIAVASARTVASERLKATMAAAEDERRRWARELHDDTLQALGGLRLHLSSARRADDLQSWRRAGEEAIRQIENEILNLRAIITDLRPPALDQIGLAAAIGTLAEQHEAVSGLVIECALPAPQRSFGAELETTLYRLVQEALTNVAKHAQATRASVTVAAADANDDTGDDTGVYITVTDDGVGFDPAAPAAGFGLAGIRERVGLVGGTLTIESNGKGTTLSIAVPRAAAPAAEPGPGQLR